MKLVEKPPPVCANGHSWREPFTVKVGWLPCGCRRGRAKLGEYRGGHRTYECSSCDHVTYVPEHDPTARPVGSGL